jgi:hypothetical protein
MPNDPSVESFGLKHACGSASWAFLYYIIFFFIIHQYTFAMKESIIIVLLFERSIGSPVLYVH